MLPLGLLTAAQGHPMLVELKNGETLNGHLVNCDTWMNLTLKEVETISNTSGSLKKSSTLRENNSSNNNISRVAGSAAAVEVGKQAMGPVEGEEGIVDEGAVDREGEAEEGTAVGEVEEAGGKAEMN
ncbi:LSM domain-containing protein [Cladophialophora immunda]|nr:LSM domain-containing protein [Cladophialophora immunda]